MLTDKVMPQGLAVRFFAQEVMSSILTKLLLANREDTAYCTRVLV